MLEKAPLRGDMADLLVSKSYTLSIYLVERNSPVVLPCRAKGEPNISTNDKIFTIE